VASWTLHWPPPPPAACTELHGLKKHQQLPSSVVEPARLFFAEPPLQARWSISDTRVLPLRRCAEVAALEHVLRQVFRSVKRRQGETKLGRKGAEAEARALPGLAPLQEEAEGAAPCSRTGELDGVLELMLSRGSSPLCGEIRLRVLAGAPSIPALHCLARVRRLLPAVRLEVEWPMPPWEER